MVKQIYKKRIYKKSNKIETTYKISSESIYLIIVESPSKCPKIESYLGSKYSCISSKGHIRTITGLKSIDTKKNYETSFDIIDEKKSHIEWMRNIIGKFDKENILLATDDDREGEAIAWHICDVFDLNVQTTPRIIFHEVTQQALLKSIDCPTTINMNIVNAQHARQVLDLLVGFKISPLLWKFLYRNKDNSLSAGRCQTPALRLVYDNDREHKSSPAEYKYKMEGIFFDKKLKFDLTKEFDDKATVMQFMEQSKTHHHTVSIGEKKPCVKSAPSPFNTSALLQSASSSLRFGPKETMSLCQQLYQDGLITYMRTESQGYAKEFIDSAFGYIEGRFSDKKYLRNPMEIENIDSKNPHEAIRVTNIHTETIECENSRAISLYKLIWRNTVQSCMTCARYEHTPVYISCPMDGMRYSHTVEIPLFLGWKALTENVNVVEEQNTGSALLFYIRQFCNVPSSVVPLSVGTNVPSVVPYKSISATIAIHGKHSHYTEASLIKRLEDIGIGRPSTFATIVDTIIERKYVKKTDIEGIKLMTQEYQLINGEIEINHTEKILGKETGKLLIQPVGILVSEFLEQHFNSMFSYDYTKNMESELDDISKGKGNDEWFRICEKCDNEIANLIKPISKLSKQIFTIQGTTDYIVVYEKYGPVLRKVLDDKSYEYKSIKSDLQIDLGKLSTGKYHIDELLDIPTETVIGEFNGNSITLKSGPYGDYIEHCGKKESVRRLTEGITEGITEELSKTAHHTVLANKFIECKTAAVENPNIIRELTPELSVRTGKFGAYIYYKTDHMKKPTFYNIQKFKESYRHCSEDVLIQWIKDQYKIKI